MTYCMLHICLVFLWSSSSSRHDQSTTLTALISPSKTKKKWWHCCFIMFFHHSICGFVSHSDCLIHCPHERNKKKEKTTASHYEYICMPPFVSWSNFLDNAYVFVGLAMLSPGHVQIRHMRYRHYMEHILHTHINCSVFISALASIHMGACNLFVATNPNTYSWQQQQQQRRPSICTWYIYISISNNKYISWLCLSNLSFGSLRWIGIIC